MSVLVTGAAGFIGSHVVDHLLAEGHEVVGLDNFDDFYDPRSKRRNLAAAVEHPDFSLAEGDLLDREALCRLPDGIDEVIHLAARAGVRPSIEAPQLYVTVNVLGTTALLEWARQRQVQRFIFASSSSVYGRNPKVPFAETDPVDEPISPYAATKRAGELMCRTYRHLFGIGFVALRFFTVYGPRQRPDLAIHKFARHIRDGLPIPMFGDGGTERDYTHIADIIQGVSKAREWLAEHPGAGEIINLGEHRTVSLWEMISTLSDEMGIEPTVTKLPMPPGDAPRTFADIDKARRLIGYAPRVEFRDGIRDFLAWFEAAERSLESGG